MIQAEHIYGQDKGYKHGLFNVDHDENDEGQYEINENDECYLGINLEDIKLVS